MRKRPWVRRTAAAALVLLALNAGVSLGLRARRVHGYLTARLEATFGRPVEVSRFGFSLLDGARLQAIYISVAEDPRFGQEYFLRAERLTAGLRWRALLRGRFEFGTLSFTRPSLNLVRAADGHWNVESWLPPPAPAGEAAGTSQTSHAPARLYRIEVDAGRINFKRGDDKHPFALVDVTGHVEQEGAGRWGIDLQARPVRATVTLQEAGTLRLQGRIAGTSARLQPAELALTWQNASLADALRLARGRDYGMRGKLAIELTARSAAPGPAGGGETPGAPWSFAATARLAGVHRWDLPPRPGDPALNLSVEALQRPGEAVVEFSKCVLEAPRSSINATGRIEWASGFAPQFQFTSSGISLADLLAWYRAFRPGVADDLTLEGSAGLDLGVSGWPPRLGEGVLASIGARLQVAGLPGPVRIGRIAARVVRGRLEFQPTTITLPGATVPGATPRQSNSLQLEGALGPAAGSARAPAKNWEFELGISGQTDRAQDLLAAAQALGHALGRGWSVEGSVGLRLRWRGSVYPFAADPLGTIDLRGLELRAAYLNQPVSFGSSRIEWRPGEQRVTLVAARGFGARWKGSLWKRTQKSSALPETWEFDLAADRLDATELDRWLGPRARPTLLQRVNPFAATIHESSEMDATIGTLRGRGRLSAEEVLVPPLSVSRLRAEAEIAGRRIIFRRAQADFYGGRVEGSLEAQLASQPAYQLRARLQGVNLAALSEATATLKGRFAGVASGELELAARGVGRENLLRTLEGGGKLRVRDAEWRGLDLRATADDHAPRRGTSRFDSAEAAFFVTARTIHLEQLRLATRAEEFDAEGAVDFSRALDFQVERLARPKGLQHPNRSDQTFRITGPLDEPQWAPLASPPGKP
jgi:hypothetical protein